MTQKYNYEKFFYDDNYYVVAVVELQVNMTVKSFILKERVKCFLTFSQLCPLIIFLEYASIVDLQSLRFGWSLFYEEFILFYCEYTFCS